MTIMDSVLRAMAETLDWAYPCLIWNKKIIENEFLDIGFIIWLKT